MTFFDKKEEVIEIQLTQYGKFLLSKGKFKPVYYEFFDDDIVYDGKFAGINETQEQIQTRIKETPRLHTQYSFSSAETQMKKNIEMIRSQLETDIFSERFIPTAEKHYSLTAPIGTSDIGSNKNPSWNVNLLKGQITNTIRYSTGSHATLHIPQIEVLPITYETFVTKKKKTVNIDLKNNVDENLSDINIASKEFVDGSRISIKDDYLLIEVKEENTPNLSENFEIEVFLIDKDLNDDRRNEQILLPLYFEKPQEEVVNGILVDDVKKTTITDFPPNFVNHFFNVFVDKEIEQNVLCEVLTEEQIIALNQNGFNFDCIARKEKQISNVFTTDVTDDDLEKC